jgi:hypothetical protein
MQKLFRYPLLFGGEPYRVGLVSLVDVMDFMEKYPESRIETVEQLQELQRVAGLALLRPLLPEDEDTSGLEFVDLVEERGGAGLTYQDVPLIFLKNVPETSLSQNLLPEIKLSNGVVRLGGFVCLMSRKRIDQEIFFNPEIPFDRQTELQWESPGVEGLRRIFPSGQYIVEKIEIRKLGTYLHLQPPKGRVVEVSSEFLLSLRR